MKALGKLILGSAAGLAITGAAQAADLPVKAKAVEYVKVCSLYGAGFFYIPGTDTCIKLNGYVRADVTINGGAAHGQPAWNGDTGSHDRYANTLIDRSRMMLAIDTRTGTEYGVVRTFLSSKFQFTTFGAGSVNPNTVNTAVPNVNSAASYGLGSLVNNSNLLDTPGGGYVAVFDVFVQFAGFTFGKSASAFASPWQGSPAGQLSSFLLGGHSGDGTGTNNIQYTAQFGNGVSATIGLDDPTVWNRTVFDALEKKDSAAVLLKRLFRTISGRSPGTSSSAVYARRATALWQVFTSAGARCSAYAATWMERERNFWLRSTRHHVKRISTPNTR